MKESRSNKQIGHSIQRHKQNKKTKKKAKENITPNRYFCTHAQKKIAKNPNSRKAANSILIFEK
jgi:hypothetical protein